MSEAGTWEQAYENIKQFIEDSEIDMHIKSSEHMPDEDNGLYLFTLEADDFPFVTEVGMPGLPLDKVRFMDVKKAKCSNYPELLVDGRRWHWKWALFEKDEIKQIFQEQIEEKEWEIKRLKKYIEKL